MGLKQLFKSWKVWLLIIFFILAIVAIRPNPWAEGAAIRSVTKDSAASLAGFQNPSPILAPMSREIVLAINNAPIKTVADYEKYVSTLRANTTITIKTNKDMYRVLVKPEYETIYLNGTMVIDYIEPYFNETLNKTINITKQKIVNKTEQRVIGVEDIGLKVYEAPTTNIRRGLDLQGGTRVLLKPETKLNSDEINSLVENMKQRLNVYGLSDIVVKPTADLSGENFILVEIAGATDQEVKELLSKQGKFEGKIGNDTVFKGGSDIKHVCKTADCSRIESCNRITEGYSCRFQFGITLSPDSAQRQADLTRNLDSQVENGESFLSKPLDLYLDDELVDSLRISEGLKGRAETEISISGGGVGITQQDAVLDASNNMKKLQTVLITGSLPVKLSIDKVDNISPTLGNTFASNILLVAVVAMALIAIAIMIRYRRFVVSVPVIITLVSELVILLGVASLIGWNIDLISIAGIIIAIGTGVDSQLVIIDEISGKHKDEHVTSNWKEKIKNAFFIVMASYFTLVVAMLPLISAGAGLLKGFAITTILGASIGVFVTRPAFAVVAEHLLKHEHQDN
jgi:preprotein translocase subunit SecD